jgi:hypothetical protein
MGKTDVDVVTVIDRVTSGINPGWPLKSTGSSIKMKGAKTILSKKHCKSRLSEGKKRMKGNLLLGLLLQCQEASYS